MLVLKDSKIYHSSDIFSLKGRIDFSKKNIFNDLVLESSSQIILWQGWDMTRKVGEDIIKIKKALSPNVDLNLHGAYSSSNGESTSLSQGASLEYNYENDHSLSIAFEDDDYEDIVSLKHRFSF